MPFKGTVAVEEACLYPGGIEQHAKTSSFFSPGTDFKSHPLTQALLDIHTDRLARMDATGVEYMLLSLTANGPQGEPDPQKAAAIASSANDWLSGQVKLNPKRFGGLASLSMHDAKTAADELTRAVKELGMFGAILNDYQEVVKQDGSAGKVYYDGDEYDSFWKTVQELDVPVYLHPRYPASSELAEGSKYGPTRRHLLGAAVQFHLDLSFHVYAIISSGILDRYPKVQLVIGHLGEGIPFNMWRANHWYNKPVKKTTRPSKEDYRHYMRNNVSITSSGNYSTKALKFCIDELGLDRCLFSIDYPYDTIEEAQAWWSNVDLPEDQKESIGRGNAIRLFKLPLDL